MQIKKPPLPVIDKPNESIRIGVKRNELPPDLLAARQQAIAALRQSAPATSPPDERVHECTKRTKSALHQAEPNQYGALVSGGVGVASIRVAPETVDRALAILNTLIRSVERLGHSISLLTSPAALLINGTLVPVVIFEQFNRCDEPADAAEMKRRHTYERKYPKFFRRMDLQGGWTHRPSGKLTIMLSNGDLHGVPCRWSDGASHKVAECIDDVTAAAILHAEVLRSTRERIDQRLAERRQSVEEQQQREAYADRLERRIAFIKERAAMLEEADRLDRLLQHVQRTNDYPSARLHEFVTLTEELIADLRRRCDALAIDEELSRSELW
jgi:hypothetical protein